MIRPIADSSHIMFLLVDGGDAMLEATGHLDIEAWVKESEEVLKEFFIFQELSPYERAYVYNRISENMNSGVQASTCRHTDRLKHLKNEGMFLRI